MADGVGVYGDTMRHVIGGRARFTAAEIAQRGEVSEDFLIAVRRAMGLPIAAPEEAIYTEADLAYVQTSAMAGEDVYGDSIAPVLEAGLAALPSGVELGG